RTESLRGRASRTWPGRRSWARPTPRRGSACKGGRCRPSGSGLPRSPSWRVRRSWGRHVVGSTQAHRGAAGAESLALGAGFLGTIQPHEREAAHAGDGADGADAGGAGGNLGAGPKLRVALDDDDALAGGRAMLHAAHHFLADEAALGEGDAVE